MELFSNNNFTFFFFKDLNGWKLNGALKLGLQWIEYHYMYLLSRIFWQDYLVIVGDN